MKVLFMANIPSPYRVEFFNELGKYTDLTVTFEGKRATDRDVKWKSSNFTSFKAVFLNGIRTRSDQFLCFDIIKILKQGFDRIIVGGYSSPTAMVAIEYMRLKGIKFFIEADGGLISQESNFKYLVKKHLISSANGWLSSGKVTSDYFIHYGADNKDIHVYPFSSLKAEDILSGCLSLDEKRRKRKKSGINENKIVISVGQFIHRKGFDILLKAWKKCPKEYGLYIIGAEPKEEYLDLQRKLGLDNVHFVGFKNKKDLKEYYQSADLFVLPTREDIWGLVINEAMGNGLPIITTNRCVAGIELVEDEKNGFIVPVEDEEALSDKVITILNNDIVCNNMAEESLRKIREYTIENMALIHAKILAR